MPSFLDVGREFPTPPQGGVNTPTFAQHPPASGGNEGERGRGGRGKGKRRGEGKRRDPQKLVDTPMFQILKNTLDVGPAVSES